jgi:hypothetical protein
LVLFVAFNGFAQPYGVGRALTQRRLQNGNKISAVDVQIGRAPAFDGGLAECGPDETHAALAHADLNAFGTKPGARQRVAEA